MTTYILTHSSILAALFGVISPHASLAEAPRIQTVGPIVHLKDNLNEDAKLGWCIDTEGRGLSDQLQAHSCKPNGDDVLFAFSADTGTIASATFDNLCMAYNAPEDAVNPFGLIACDAADPNQVFAYDTDSMQIHLASAPTQCLTVAETIDDAGPYQSRDLILAACDGLEASFKEWVIKDYSK